MIPSRDSSEQIVRENSIAEKQRLDGAIETCTESGCRWPVFGSRTANALPTAYQQLLSNDWLDFHQRSCIIEIVIPTRIEFTMVRRLKNAESFTFQMMNPLIIEERW